MNYQADRAESLFQQAYDLLPQEDFKALLAPRVMHRIYHRLLTDMRADNFLIFERTYRLSKWQKILLLLKECLRRKK